MEKDEETEESEEMTAGEMDELAGELEKLYADIKHAYKNRQITRETFEEKKKEVLSEIDLLLKKKKNLERQQIIKEMDGLRGRLQKGELNEDEYAREYLPLVDKLQTMSGKPTDDTGEKKEEAGKQVRKVHHHTEHRRA